MSANYHTFSDSFLEDAEFATAITAASNNGGGVDTQGYRRAVAIFVSIPSGTGTTSDCKLQESSVSVSASMADVTNATFTQATTVGGKQIQFLNIDLSKRLRYLRLVHTGAGGSAAGVAAGVILLGEPQFAAVAHVTAPVTV